MSQLLYFKYVYPGVSSMYTIFFNSPYSDLYFSLSKCITIEEKHQKSTRKTSLYSPRKTKFSINFQIKERKNPYWFVSSGIKKIKVAS